jgi:predicted transcriptional regulator
MNGVLTKAEEKVMNILWLTKRGVIRDVVKQYEEPKPAYTTVATIFRILEKKGFVGRKPIANTYEYYPLIAKKDYTNGFIKSFVKTYFSDSFKNMVSQFSNKDNLSVEEMEELIASLQKQVENKNKP